MRVAHARAICCEDRSWGGKGALDRTPALRRLRPRLCKLPSGCAPAGDVYTRSMAPAAILLLLLTAEASVVRHPLSHLRLARLTSVSRCEPARLTGVVDTASETEETDEWAEFEAWINRKKQQEEEEARPRQGRTPSPFALNWYLPRHATGPHTSRPVHLFVWQVRAGRSRAPATSTTTSSPIAPAALKSLEHRLGS